MMIFTWGSSRKGSTNSWPRKDSFIFRLNYELEKAAIRESRKEDELVPCAEIEM